MTKKLKDDVRFKHVNYQHTDLRKTFARVRREQKREPVTEPDPKITHLPVVRRRAS